ncbi:unnamed protein product, partial [Staurois parvus]
ARTAVSLGDVVSPISAVQAAFFSHQEFAHRPVEPILSFRMCLQILIGSCDGSHFGWGAHGTQPPLERWGDPSQLPISLLCISHPVPVRATG